MNLGRRAEVDQVLTGKMRTKPDSGSLQYALVAGMGSSKAAIKSEHKKEQTTLMY
jgi:hypothetical protein